MRRGVPKTTPTSNIDRANAVRRKGISKKRLFVFAKPPPKGHAEAQYNLGVCHEHGYGVEKDLGQAADWYRKAAAQKHAKAQEALKKLGR